MNEKKQPGWMDDPEEYWNQDGGRRWVENIDYIEGLLAPLGQRLLRAVTASPGDEVLDVGCGGGITSRALANAVAPDGSVLGLDISAVILEVARRRNGDIINLTFVQGDAQSMDLGAGRFDRIVSRFGVMFFKDPAAAFANLRRALRPGARLQFICWRGLEQNPWLQKPTEAAFTVLTPPPAPEPGAPGPFALADETHIESLLATAGFKKVHLDAIDASLALGPLPEAVEYLMRIGPAAEPLHEAGPEQRQAVRAAMTAALQPFLKDDGVVAPCACWGVSATG